MDDKSRSRVAAGMMLIVVGLGLYVMKYFGAVGPAVAQTIIGALGIAIYLRTRSYFFLVAGAVILGLGLGSFGDEKIRLAGDFTQIGLGIGFLLIYLIPLIYEKRTHWWPLVPAGILLLLGFDAWRRFRLFLTNEGWPLILVIIGLVMLVGAVTGGRRGKRPEG